MNSDNNYRDKLGQKEFFKRWLEKLQQESWQLELLISGFALFGIWEARDFLDIVQEQVILLPDSELPVKDTFDLFAGFMLPTAWLIFFINLLIHVILRSLWIGAIGLRYISDEIDLEGLNYSRRFTEYLEASTGSYDDFIERLEKICSVLFSYTFLLVLFFLSLSLWMASIIVCSGFWIFLTGGREVEPESWQIVVLAVFLMTYIILSLIVFLDFITSGGIRRSGEGWLGRIYMPIFRFFSTITLSFLYRPLLYNFIDNKYSRRLFFFSIPYFLTLFFINGSFIQTEVQPHSGDEYQLGLRGMFVDYSMYMDLYVNQYALLPEYKKSEYRKERSYIQLGKYRNTTNQLDLFVRFNPRDYKLLNANGFMQIEKYGWLNIFQGREFESAEQDSIEVQTERQIKHIKKLEDSLRREMIRSSDSTRYSVRIDSLRESWRCLYESKKEQLDFLEDQNYKDNLEGYKDLFEVSIDGVLYKNQNCYYYNHPVTGDLGLLCHYSIDSLSIGSHIMDIKRYFYKGEDTDSRTRKNKIPFQKVKYIGYE